jgi:hypothetical protein
MKRNARRDAVTVVTKYVRISCGARCIATRIQRPGAKAPFTHVLAFVGLKPHANPKSLATPCLLCLDPLQTLVDVQCAIIERVPHDPIQS